MPRPKRSRVASARLTAQKSSSATPPVAAHPSAVEKAKTSSSDIYDVSDREKERQRKRVEEAAASRLEMNSEQAQALEDSRRRRDDAMDKLANITSTSKDSTDHADDSPAIELSRREDASTMLRPARVTDASGLDLDDSMSFGNLDDSLNDSHNAIEETRSGYRSTDTSSFNINLFKRRPRQSSIVGKDDAPIRPSSRGPNTPSIISHLNLGLFKRRAREPSILGTAQKDRSTRPHSRATSVASHNGHVTADEESGPDDESTPLKIAKRRSDATPTVPPSAEGSPALPSRKRKSLESHEGGREKRPALDNDEEEEEIIHQSIEVDNTPLIPSTPPNRSKQNHFSTPVHDPNDPDMAPPASSGSEDGDSPVVWPTLDTLTHRTYNTKRPARAHKTPEPNDGDNSSELSSPPSLTHSPNYGAAAKARRKPAVAVVKVATTADLTSLLPKRRNKAKSGKNRNDPFDLDSSSVLGQDDEDDDEDELSYVDAAKRRRQRQRAALASRNANSTSTSAKGKSAKAKGKEAAEKEKGKKVRTYGSRGADKENEWEGEIVVADEDMDGDEVEEQEEADPETTQMMTERLGEELQKAAKKFKEVDQWELSFEEVTVESDPAVDGR
ncbi:hypothetical protein B0H66DRAFT_566102 [Apodospora peruviana]|uniref:Uncharacterized protein n=1 Tax=Apodospora peruviana TaxID=516989 RepID=A0AAE0HV43_9PEZI|nr:hypothetical protein B0H66DRAFT_566102 [Apodospora peruviana]